jgi:hypothetical protein
VIVIDDSVQTEQSQDESATDESVVGWLSVDFEAPHAHKVFMKLGMSLNIGGQP